MTMPDKTIRSAQGAGSADQQPAGRWKVRCSAGQDPVTGAPIHRATYGQTPQEAAERFADSMGEKPHTTRKSRRGR